MIDPATRAKYTTTIGIECHVQLKTKTKLFAAVGNDAREAPPNTLISFICLGMPGALPVLNSAAIDLAMKAAFALNTKPQHFSKFDRKHYFYPDLPKGYQITQFDQPVIIGGYVDIMVDGQTKRVGVTRAHLEEDAGKSTHPAGKDYSLVDLNRAGTPLLEIVSEPDMHTAAEAKAYAHELWLLMRYADASYANLYYGNMRFDVNVSVSRTTELGTRSETKNLNSFRSVEKAVEYEVTRQIELLEKGEAVVQETRGWDDAKQRTFSQRSKEDAHDYRYMPEPDVPPVELSEAQISTVEAAMPRLPAAYRQAFTTLGLDSSATEALIDSPDNAAFVSNALDKDATHAKRIANWLVNVAATDEETSADINKASLESALALSRMVADKKLSSSAAKEVWLELYTKGGDPQQIAEAKNLLQESDEAAIIAIVDQVLAENPKAARDVREGQDKVIGFLVGQVMKASKGKANPSLAQDLIRKQLNT
jgi:aspartyl-tRNA(Asn)/glutamyl-tRNA(Gln) amidotransferase subunit B